MRVLDEIADEPDAVGIHERRGAARADDRKRAPPEHTRHVAPPQDRTERETPEVDEPEETLDVEVAPDEQQRHREEERPNRAARARPLDQQQARRHAGEGERVRTGERARLEDEEPEHDDGGTCRASAARAAGGVEERQRHEHHERLRELERDGTAEPPEPVGRDVEEPGRRGLRVVGVREAEKVRTRQRALGDLASLGEMPPEVRLVGPPKAHEHARDETERHEHGDREA